MSFQNCVGFGHLVYCKQGQPPRPGDYTRMCAQHPIKPDGGGGEMLASVLLVSLLGHSQT